MFPLDVRCVRLLKRWIFEWSLVPLLLQDLNAVKTSPFLKLKLQLVNKVFCLKMKRKCNT